MPRKKTKNKRNKRRHVLDVKLASNQIRKRRISMAISTLITIVVLVGTVYGLWRGGYWAAQKFVYQNKSLSIEHFEVRTDGVIDPRHLVRWSGVQRGDNLFDVDLHGIKVNLQKHGMIKHVALARALPDTLRMQVEERIPVAMIRVGELDKQRGIVYRKFALDVDANLMDLDTKIVRPETAMAWDSLPWLTTTNLNNVFSARDLRNPQIKAALQFIREFEQAEIRDNITIEKVDIDDKYVLRVSVSNGAVVDILSEEYPRQLARWKSIHSTLARQNETYSWIDLSVSNNIPVHRFPLNSPNPTNSTRQF